MVHAQIGRVNRYTYNTFVGTYSSIAGIGTQITSTGGDDNTYALSLPFAFNYDSTVQTSGKTIYASTNGLLSFYTSGSGCCSSQLGSTSYQGTLLWFSQDDYTTGAMYYATTGTAPNRVFTVEWQSLRFYSGNTAFCDMQVKLYETSNNIEYWYSTNSLSMGSRSAGIGLNGFTSPSFLSLTVTTTSSTPSGQIRLTPPSNSDAQLTSSPKVVDFGQQPAGVTATKIVTIQNLGVKSNLTLNNLSMSGSPDFTIASAPPLGSTLAPGASATITISLTPSGNGTRTGVLTIITDGRDSGSQSIGLTAVGLAPLISVDTTILFKKILTKMGQSTVGRILVTASGPAPVFFTSYPISGIDGDQYSVIRTPVNPLPAGQTDTLLVRYTPTREGRRTATLTINSNALNSPALPIQLIGTGILPHIVVTPSVAMRFDSVAIGDSVCKTVTVWNSGSDTLIISKNALTSNDGDYTYYSMVGSDTLIPPDKTRTMNICFKPKQRGERSARLAFRTNIIPTFESPRRDTASLITLDIQGTGVPFGVFAHSNGGVLNDTAIVGTQVCATDTIFNRGESDILISSIAFSGANAAEYTLNPVLLPFLLKAGSQMILTICGTPAQSGLRTATLSINGKSNDRVTNTSVAISTLGIRTCLSPSPNELFSGFLIYRGSDTTMCDTVTNCGDIAAVYTASISGANASDYSVSPSSTQSVAPGATAVFCVTYHPTVTGSSPATMTISAANTQSQTVSLGGAACCAHLTADAVIIPPTNAGGHSTFTLTINNSGGCDWNAGSLQILGDTGVFHVASVGTVAGNGNKQVTVNYDPTDINHTYTAQVSFPNGGPCQDDTLTVNFSQQTGSQSVRQQTEQDGFVLGQNRPNPFASMTAFSYTVPTEAAISLTLSDMTGRIVRTITTGRVSAGEHTVSIDANELASGTYVISLQSGNILLNRQIVIAK
ncbi:MAG: choice-of-anchor D domain-containing protein [Bacteroidetes bacterium]|nr:choice-of-anchor D domain-containing protein [Bacteroidota bacterium]